MAKDPTRTAKKLALFAVAMFGFGFALVPIYEVVCEATGIGGRTGVISQSEAEADQVDAERLVTVEFDTNVDSALPWAFKAAEFNMKVHPGEMAEAVFVVENRSDKPVIGKAVPSVAPPIASKFFDKTECFCFTEQRLEAGERKEMIVRFVVGSQLPEDILIMTLSYRFFQVPDNADVAISDTKAVKTKI
ncbi:MAG: cytochrome c oxidase assembly protein [Proteobacteria bacterium]|nr:cytochrome c oxidase assembly protein [Pseudomonadota bacterium]NOG60686.1 cytochrome c oxidase assembly protein [Pseudomonadota bacterium]